MKVSKNNPEELLMIVVGGHRPRAKAVRLFSFYLTSLRSQLTYSLWQKCSASI